MKAFVYTILMYAALTGCGNTMTLHKGKQQTQFLYKTKLDTSAGNYGQHINVKLNLKPTGEMRALSVDDRQLIAASGYTRADYITILGEYLTFYGDTITSNKTYQLRAAYFLEHPADLSSFTVQVEALYSFTRMLTVGLPPIRPVLFDRTTGKKINADAKKINEVYSIYKRWYEENKKTGFQDIALPLTGSDYYWLVEDTSKQLLLKKSL